MPLSGAQFKDAQLSPDQTLASFEPQLIRAQGLASEISTRNYLLVIDRVMFSGHQHAFPDEQDDIVYIIREYYVSDHIRSEPPVADMTTLPQYLRDPGSTIGEFERHYPMVFRSSMLSDS
ncbi:hypothetical protein SARC_06979 [Sphaeroforma arctica JP610]|uniref:Uncharacterized protein n=1 Tax=Sphaeroforma arctica JP610 TaxID=667725 RepID=A0A0L0FUZ4_9EUKA|nr:hypothetical protein SARC_06979 [Sphaeroforma arctica JP610]KNC80665.1 hypothetical protein SARC_06979 [Sphaeroforma arctica JP610]|eukprot:XP_014154567.1 hypothetical protein SARC_06979 [Sphaeroforma arctica JP610]